MSNVNDKIVFILPCHFGLEAVTKKEVIALGYNILEVKDGEVYVEGFIHDIPILNVNLRTVERVLIEVGRFTATTFDELFENVRKLEIERYISKDDRFDISKANSDKNSLLYSQRDIQSIVKKAMVERLKFVYKMVFLPENGNIFKFRVKFLKNVCSIRLDTTGDSLHKRGYRIKPSDAPISETLAASIIMLTPFKTNRILLDPFCGSGTFAIESALISANIPAGLNRNFAFQQYTNLLGKQVWDDVFSKGKDEINREFLKQDNITIFASDIQVKMINIAKYNAKKAGVLNIINFETRNVKDVQNDKKYGFLITNPPYGERVGSDANLDKIYNDLMSLYKKLDTWSMYVITSYENANKIFSKVNKNRKIYNGMMKTYLYQFFGPPIKNLKL